MTLTLNLALRHLHGNKKRTAWTIFSITLAVGMLISIGGFGMGGEITLQQLVDYFDLADGFGAVGVISQVLMVILWIFVSIASIVVISNAFNVSIMERTKQIGILKSTGATKKQIHKTVMWEGFLLAIISIPIGLVLGIIMHGVALLAINTMVDLSFAEEVFRFEFYFNASITVYALVLSFVVTMFSAWLPAKKAAKIPAIEAIKGSGQHNIRKEKVRKSTIITKIFGFEGTLAIKQLRRNRRYFSAMVRSITLSIVLILVSVSLSTHMSRSMHGRLLQMGVPNAVFILTASPEKSAINIDSALISTITEAFRQFPHTQVSEMGVRFFNTADDTFVVTAVVGRASYLELIDIAGVADGSNLLINVHTKVDASSHLVQYNPFAFMQGEVLALYAHEGANQTTQWASSPQYFTLHGEVTFLPDHLIHLSEAGKIIVLPDGEVEIVHWFANTTDSYGFAQFATQVFHEKYTLQAGETFTELDFTAVFAILNAVIDTALAYVRIFAIMLIFLGLTNVASTIVTSIKLRSREFAVLTSIGMDSTGMRKMLALESLFSAIRALIFGLPLGFIAAYVTYLSAVEANPVGVVFTPPLMAMALCAIGVVVVTFTLMQLSEYALKNNRIIEAIRGVE